MVATGRHRTLDRNITALEVRTMSSPEFCDSRSRIVEKKIQLKYKM